MSTELEEDESDSSQSIDSRGQSGIFPDSEEVETRAFTKLIRSFDFEPAKANFGDDEEVIKTSERKLVEQMSTSFRRYVYQGLVILSVSIILGTVIDRYVWPIPIQAYGLILNIYGAFILAVPSTLGRYQIALESVEDIEAVLESKARQTATTMGGLFALLVGFLIQLIAVLAIG